jgi:hypothetical protein
MHGHQVGVNAQLLAHQPLVCHRLAQNVAQDGIFGAVHHFDGHL